MFEKYFMIKNAFGNIQCLLCYKTLKAKREYFLKRHFELLHTDMKKFKEKERDEIFKKSKKKYLDTLKGWLINEENDDNKSGDMKINSQLSKYVSLNIIRQGRPFSDGKFVKEILQNIFFKLKYDPEITESLILYRK